MAVQPRETIVHRALTPLGQKGMVCWLFLTTAGMTELWGEAVEEAESKLWAGWGELKQEGTWRR